MPADHSNGLELGAHRRPPASPPPKFSLCRASALGESLGAASRPPDVKGGLPAGHRRDRLDAGSATITAIRIARQPCLPFDPQLDELPEPIRSAVSVDPHTDCWRCATLSHDRDGYARYRGEGVHRYVYKTLVGEIPPGYQIDHVRARGCAWRDCCNPSHLEAVPPIVNWERGCSPTRINAEKTRCDSGHDFTEANTYVKPNGHRDCRACGRVRVAKYKRRLARRRPYVQQLAA